jgi:3',5'-cyclic AMP phosphodiesterase CpdA
MPANLRLAITADLHWGSHESGDQATRLLLTFLRQEPPDVLILAGDIGAGEHFAECLALFDNLPCRKALVPGNHDIWVADNDPRGDSFQVYCEYLPRISGEHGFHYLDHGPLLIEEADLSMVGSINWYDYSWSIDQLKTRIHDWERRLRAKVFSRGRHNDARFVRWPLDDEQFTTLVVEELDKQLRETLSQAGKAIVIAHHPPFYGLTSPRLMPPVTVDGLLWDAFSGNRRLELILAENAERIPFVFCGHTHRARENTLNAIRGHNIGGDYHFKRLLMLDWPAGTVTAHVFGDPGA